MAAAAALLALNACGGAARRAGPQGLSEAGPGWSSAFISWETSGLDDSDVRVLNAIGLWEKQTCLYFPRCAPCAAGDERLTFAAGGVGCSYSSATKTVTVGTGCGRAGVAAAVGEAIGLAAEHKRRDRTSHLTVDTAAADPAKTAEFNTLTGISMHAYDLLSIMHPDRRAWAVGSAPTLVSASPMGRRWGLSETDRKSVQFLYDCTGVTGATCVASMASGLTLKQGTALQAEFSARYTQPLVVNYQITPNSGVVKSPVTGTTANAATAGVTPSSAGPVTLSVEFDGSSSSVACTVTAQSVNEEVCFGRAASDPLSCSGSTCGAGGCVCVGTNDGPRCAGYKDCPVNERWGFDHVFDLGGWTGGTVDFDHFDEGSGSLQIAGGSTASVTLSTGLMPERVTFALLASQSSTVSVVLKDTSGSPCLTLPASLVLNDDDWHHYDLRLGAFSTGTLGQWALHIDGALKDPARSSSSTCTTGFGQVDIAVTGGAAWADEVALWCTGYVISTGSFVESTVTADAVRSGGLLLTLTLVGNGLEWNDDNVAKQMLISSFMVSGVSSLHGWDENRDDVFSSADAVVTAGKNGKELVLNSKAATGYLSETSEIVSMNAEVIQAGGIIKASRSVGGDWHGLHVAFSIKGMCAEAVKEPFDAPSATVDMPASGATRDTAQKVAGASSLRLDGAGGGSPAIMHPSMRPRSVKFSVRITTGSEIQVACRPKSSQGVVISASPVSFEIKSQGTTFSFGTPAVDTWYSVEVFFDWVASKIKLVAVDGAVQTVGVAMPPGMVVLEEIALTGYGGASTWVDELEILCASVLPLVMVDPEPGPLVGVDWVSVYILPGSSPLSASDHVALVPSSATDCTAAAAAYPSACVLGNACSWHGNGKVSPSGGGRRALEWLAQRFEGLQNSTVYGVCLHDLSTGQWNLLPAVIGTGGGTCSASPINQHVMLIGSVMTPQAGWTQHAPAGSVLGSDSVVMPESASHATAVKGCLEICAAEASCDSWNLLADDCDGSVCTRSCKIFSAVTLTGSDPHAYWAKRCLIDSPTASPSTPPTKQPSAPPTRPPSVAPSATPSASPSRQPSTPPSLRPSVRPSVPPSVGPSRAPSVRPSVAPSVGPTVPPTGLPSGSPSRGPSRTPAAAPTLSPSARPSVAPTASPSLRPTAAPTLAPTLPPSATPSRRPTVPPSGAPTLPPTLSPSRLPSASPSSTPSAGPSRAPSSSPTIPPSTRPSAVPSAPPSLPPTVEPTAPPSAAPSTSPSDAPTAPTAAPASLHPPTATESRTRTLLPPVLTATLTVNYDPTAAPSASPSASPSAAPSAPPSALPSLAPSRGPLKAASTRVTWSSVELVKSADFRDAGVEVTARVDSGSFSEAHIPSCVSISTDRGDLSTGLQWALGKGKTVVSVTNTSGNSSVTDEVTVLVGKVGGYSADGDETLTLEMAPSCFSAASLPDDDDHLHHSFTVVKEPIPATAQKEREAADTIIATSGAVATTAVAVASTGAAAGSGGRLVIAAETGCGEHDEEYDALPVTLHPTRLEFGGALGVHAGCVVGNSALCIGSALLQRGVGLVLMQAKGLSRRPAEGMIRYPSASVFLVLFLYPGTCLSGARLVLHPVYPWHIPLGTFGLVLAILLPFWAIRKPLKRVPRRAVWCRDRAVSGRPFLAFLVGQGDWVNLRGSSYVQRYGLLFKSAKPGQEQLLVAWDCTLSFVLAIINGIKVSTLPECGIKRFVMAAATVAYIMYVTRRRPFSRWRDLLLDLLMQSLQAAALVLIGCGFHAKSTGHSNTGQRFFSAGIACVAAGAALMLFRVSLDMAAVAYGIKVGRQARLSAQLTPGLEEELVAATKAEDYYFSDSQPPSPANKVSELPSPESGSQSGLVITTPLTKSPDSVAPRDTCRSRVPAFPSARPRRRRAASYMSACGSSGAGDTGDEGEGGDGEDASGLRSAKPPRSRNLQSPKPRVRRGTRTRGNSLSSAKGEPSSPMRSDSLLEGPALSDTPHGLHSGRPIRTGSHPHPPSPLGSRELTGDLKTLDRGNPLTWEPSPETSPPIPSLSHTVGAVVIPKSPAPRRRRLTALAAPSPRSDDGRARSVGRGSPAQIALTPAGSRSPPALSSEPWEFTPAPAAAAAEPSAAHRKQRSRADSTLSATVATAADDSDGDGDFDMFLNTTQTSASGSVSPMRRIRASPVRRQRGLSAVVRPKSPAGPARPRAGSSAGRL